MNDPIAGQIHTQNEQLVKLERIGKLTRDQRETLDLAKTPSFPFLCFAEHRALWRVDNVQGFRAPATEGYQAKGRCEDGGQPPHHHAGTSEGRGSTAPAFWFLDLSL